MTSEIAARRLLSRVLNGTMSNLLAIDTTDFSISLALMRDGALVSERQIKDPGVAEHLISNIRLLLGEEKICFGDLDKIAIIVGPGSYTGIRSGLATVLGICLGAGNAIEIVSVSKLQAQAFFSVKAVAKPQIIFSLLTANALEYFAGVYYCEPHWWSPLQRIPTFIRITNGDNFSLYEMRPPTLVPKSELEAFTENIPADFKDIDVTKIIDADINFASVAAAMADIIQTTTGISELKPLYIKPVNAKTLAEREG